MFRGHWKFNTGWLELQIIWQVILFLYFICISIIYFNISLEFIFYKHYSPPIQISAIADCGPSFDVAAEGPSFFWYYLIPFSKGLSIHLLVLLSLSNLLTFTRLPPVFLRLFLHQLPVNKFYPSSQASSSHRGIVTKRFPPDWSISRLKVDQFPQFHCLAHLIPSYWFLFKCPGHWNNGIELFQHFLPLLICSL